MEACVYKPSATLNSSLSSDHYIYLLCILVSSLRCLTRTSHSGHAGSEITACQRFFFFYLNLCCFG